MTPSPSRTEINLHAGRLIIDVLSTDVPLDALCTFASRHNPKRNFLFVSKVLGKHVPVSFKTAEAVQVQLAKKIPSDLEGKIAWVGMAETATGLAEMLAREWLIRNPCHVLYFQITTRYPSTASYVTRFEESHSHATLQTIELSPANADMDHLVLVDDEVTTGHTFIQLVELWKQHSPRLKHVIWVVLKSWLPCDLEKAHTQRLASLGIRLEIITLLKGSYQFIHTHPSADAPISQADIKALHAVPSTSTTARILGMDSRRQGIHLPIQDKDNASILTLDNLKIPACQYAYIVGFGECHAPAFLLARHLREQNIDSFIQGITRSPIMEGEHIQHKTKWHNPYDQNNAYYSYNIDPKKHASLHIITECPKLDLPSQQWNHAWIWHWNGLTLSRIG